MLPILDDDTTVAAATTAAYTTETLPTDISETTTELASTTTTTTPATPTTITAPATETTTTKKATECSDTKYCFNGGKCILNELGYPHCICTEGFYGNRCQTKDICKSVIVDSLTGDQICAKLDRGCFKNDKFFRCSCHEDEYFVFKVLKDPAAPADPSQQPTTDQRAARLSNNEGQQRPTSATNLKRSKSERLYELLNQQLPNSAKFAYDPNTDNQNNNNNINGQSSKPTMAPPTNGGSGGSPADRSGYLAECRKIDKCLGVRCRQLSEVCSDGECVCNQDAGYVSDPTDGGACKLLDPCSMPSMNQPADARICGQARCVATFNRDLFRCVCPVGHKLIQIGDRKSSSICAPLNDAICELPLLNKCQHLCHIDLVQNTYIRSCSCFRGYRPGQKPGIDDHMCFFDELTDEEPSESDMYGADDRSRAANDQKSGDKRAAGFRPDDIFRWYKIPPFSDPKFVPATNNTSSSSSSPKFTYDDSKPKLVPVRSGRAERDGDDGLFADSDLVKSLRPDQYLIRREPFTAAGRNGGGRDSWPDEWDQNDDESTNVAKMSAQERCNKMCGENRICVLENGSSDSYRCICDRQGYVSIGDKCLNWCAAAEFSAHKRMLLYKYGCWTQVCRPTADSLPQFWDYSGSEASDGGAYADADTNEKSAKSAADEMSKLLRSSSWRPEFECDCSSSPFLKQDPETRLCQLDFKATLEPCLPGNVGYIDCVENKNAYCAVLHRSSWSFIKDLIHDKYKDSSTKSGSRPDESQTINSAGKSKSKQAKLVNEKLYTCVCSPDKKFLVDKPRNKERCVDECNMLNIECVRFNRMCRSASIAPEDFGRNNLVRYDLDGAVKMNFRRTGCECLPGFNVGPTESVDFTLDDEDDSSQQQSSASSSSNRPQPDSSTQAPSSAKDPDGYPMMPDILDSDDILDQAEHMRAKYINIDSSCLLDYDVVEFHASFKSPADFDPSWIRIKNPLPEWPASKRDDHSHSSQKSDCETGTGTGTSTNNKSASCDFGEKPPATGEPATSSGRSHHQSPNETGFWCEPQRGCQLRVPKFMLYNITDLHKNVVLVAQCEPAIAMQSLDAYQECVRYRYWIIQKLRRHYIDWRRVITRHLSETFDLMDGNIRLRVNRCESTLKSVSVREKSPGGAGDTTGAGAGAAATAQPRMVQSEYLDPMDPQSIIDADIDCELTLHSASDGSSPRYSRKVLLEKQLQRFIFVEPTKSSAARTTQETRLVSIADAGYYLMAPNMLIRRESFDQLAEHRKLFNPCESDYAYCDMQTDCYMVDTVNFTCTCKFGYTPIGSRDIYYGDSRKEVCEDIDECLFDVCKDLAGVADCENTIGDYKCLCRNQYTGDNKRYCNHVCNTIGCHPLHGKCRIVAPHHALCECEDGYKEADCSVQDPNVALRKANMIIVGSIFTSVLLLMITLAISLNSQLKKTKKKLKRLEAISATANLFELHTPQPFRPRMSKAS